MSATVIDLASARRLRTLRSEARLAVQILLAMAGGSGEALLVAGALLAMQQRWLEAAALDSASDVADELGRQVHCLLIWRTAIYEIEQQREATA